MIIFNGDILQAFGNLAPHLAARALHACGVHPRIIAAFINELIGQECWPDFEGVALSTAVPFHKGRQGGTDTPFLWNGVMKMILAQLDPIWRESGYGL